ncbi:MAG: ribonuclease P protein component [SAR202 cluster bacterium]|nr:ribonuclease P protein component [SAR202 cluster bacterium]
MRKDQRLKGKERFSQIFEGSRGWANSRLVLKALPNSSAETRFGLVTSRKVGGAVLRNTLRRRLREIVRVTPVKSGWDVVIIVRSGKTEPSFQELQDALHNLLRRAGLLEPLNPGL